MLRKKGTEACRVKSYRPISITPCIARLFERTILSRLKSHLTENNLIIKPQSGFRNFRQTKDNLVFLSQKVQQSFIEKKKTLAIIFDIESAFDKVWHNGLLYKLATLKIPYYIIKTIEHFIKDRSFVVKVNGSTSNARTIYNGFPQGAVLSPTLFNIYINDLPIKSTHNESSILFADDIGYLLTFKCPKEAEKISQDYLNHLELWAKKWRLKFAPHKCTLTIFSRARKFDLMELNIKLNGIKIPEDDEPKLFGIKFDRRLNFSAQIKNIKSKVADRLNIMKI